jgi:hypothetical protein
VQRDPFIVEATHLTFLNNLIPRRERPFVTGYQSQQFRVADFRAVPITPCEQGVASRLELRQPPLLLETLEGWSNLNLYKARSHHRDQDKGKDDNKAKKDRTYPEGPALRADMHGRVQLGPESRLGQCALHFWAARRASPDLLETANGRPPLARLQVG